MKLKLLSIGKLKDPAYLELARDYSQRIQRYHPFETFEIAAETIHSEAQKPKALEEEAAKIRQQLKKNAFLIVLDEKGKSMNSIQLAEKIEGLFLQSFSEIVFLIGGAYGVAESLKQEANLLLSLSPLTLPHRLARVVVLEQIYRAMTIIHRSSYHHE